MDISSISAMHRSTYEERQENLGYLRQLYSFFALTLIIAVLWTNWCLRNTKLGTWVTTYWGLALAAAIIALIILLICLFAPFARQSPINLVLWALFTITFAYAVSYLCVKDKSGLCWYTLCLLAAIAVAFAIYSFFSQNYLQSLSAMLFIILAALLVMVLFIVFTNISFLGMIFCTLGAIIFGFYLNYDIRKMVRGNIYRNLKEDAPTGSVRLWGEVGLVFCRICEMLSGIFTKSGY